MDPLLDDWFGPLTEGAYRALFVLPVSKVAWARVCGRRPLRALALLYLN